MIIPETLYQLRRSQVKYEVLLRSQETLDVLLSHYRAHEKEHAEEFKMYVQTYFKVLVSDF